MAAIFSFFQKDVRDKLSKYFEAIIQCSIQEFKRKNAKLSEIKIDNDKNVANNDTIM